MEYKEDKNSTRYIGRGNSLRDLGPELLCLSYCKKVRFFLARHVAIYNRLQAQKALMMIL